MRRNSRRRGKPAGRIAAIAAVTLGLLAAGWFGSSLFVSPAQREASATPPEPRPIAAPVERGALTDTVTFAVTAGREDRKAVPVTGRGGDAVAVVTDVPLRAGESAAAGDPILEVNGRPILLLPGAFAFYRDLQAGDKGPDVRQLQTALRGAGAKVSVTGTLDPVTETAVKNIYNTAGYDEPSDAVLRASEVTVFGAPATIISTVEVGALADGSATVVLEAGETVGRAVVPPAVGGQLSSKVRGSVLGTDTEVTVISVEPAEDPTADTTVLVSPTDPVEASEYTVQFETLRVIDDELIVPTTAVAESGDRAFVIKAGPNEENEQVEVRILGTLNGRTAVEPLDGKSLGETDEVLIG